MLPRLPELAREVAEISNGVVAAARGAGRGDLADLLVQAAGRWTLPGVVVAVVGEGGVGKTALVNALVGSRVLPTRELVARSTLAVVRPAAEASATASARGSTVSLELDPGAIATWLDAQGPVSDAVTSLDVAVVDPATGPALSFVDTPGVAASGTGRDRAVVTALQCDVLLYVTDADSPLTRPELDLLAAARGTAGAVLVVLSRVDRFRGWSQVRHADEALVSAELPGRVQVLPASSSLAAAGQAQRGRDDEQAAALEDESGVPAVRRALSLLTERIREVRLAGLLHLAGQVGQELEAARAVSEATASLGRAEAAGQADARQADLEALRARAATVVTSLGDESNRLRELLVLEVKRAGSAALAARDEAKAGKRRRDGDEDALLDALDEARLLLEASVAERTDALASWLLARLTQDEPGSSPLRAPVPTPGAVAAASRDRSLRLRFIAALVSSGSGVVLMASMASGSGDALRPALLSLGMMTGGVSALAMVASSGSQKLSSTRKVATKGLVDEWQALTGSALRAQVTTGQRLTETALRTSVTDAVADLTRQVAELRARAAGQDGDGPSGDGRVLRAHLARIDELRSLVQAT